MARMLLGTNSLYCLMVKCHVFILMRSSKVNSKISLPSVHTWKDKQGLRGYALGDRDASVIHTSATQRGLPDSSWEVLDLGKKVAQMTYPWRQVSALKLMGSKVSTAAHQARATGNSTSFG